jgi:hypothetical protein
MSDDQLPSDEVLRGMVLKALHERRYEDLVDFDKALEALRIPFNVKRGILRQLEENGLVHVASRPLADDHLGVGRITAPGIAVQEGEQPPPQQLSFTNTTFLLTDHRVHRLAPATYPTAMLEDKASPLIMQGRIVQALYLSCWAIGLGASFDTLDWGIIPTR